MFFALVATTSARVHSRVPVCFCYRPLGRGLGRSALGAPSLFWHFSELELRVRAEQNHFMGKYLDKLVVSLFLATALQLHGQGYVYTYDQQSATTPETINYDNFVISRLMLYESFVPTLSSIDFVQLELTDYPDSNTSGAKICVGIYSGSPTDPTLLGTSELVSLPANFHNDGIDYSGVATFDFATPITLTPGETYYLVPVEITGDDVWSVAVTDNTYSSGGLYGFQGTDLWFREGIETVPEPADLALLAIGGVLMVCSFLEMHPSSTPTANTI